MERIEVGLEVQGCTAIEDKLQDRVPWTIHLCIRAGNLLNLKFKLVAF